MSAQLYPRPDQNPQKDPVPEPQGPQGPPKHPQEISPDGRTLTKERAQLDLSKDAIRRVDQLQSKLEAISRAEIFRISLRRLEWMVNDTHSDDPIEVIDKEGNIRA